MEKFNNIKVISQNNEGNGICKINNIITFVPYTLPNEIVDIKIEKQKKNYNEGKLISIIKKTNERTKPLCKYYYECGGCNIMHESYEAQLEFKKNKVINNLKHIANIIIKDDLEIVKSDQYNYRNHITINVENNKMGFYKSKSNEIVNIEKCVISNKKINNILKEINKFINNFPNNNISKISIKAYKEILINIISDNFKLKNEFKKYINYDSLYLNNTYIDGLKYVSENLNNYKFNISCLSFFQKNTYIATKLYEYIKSMISNNENVLDLYCGTGSIGIYISNKCKSVLGIEVIDEAVKMAEENAKLNKVNNIKFISGKVDDNLDNLDVIDTIILDPPRVGLSKKVINNLLNIKANKIIYVSCDSVTLSRDIKLLSSTYNIDSIKLFDMFPNTYHVENVILLQRKD